MWQEVKGWSLSITVLILTILHLMIFIGLQSCGQDSGNSENSAITDQPTPEDTRAESSEPDVESIALESKSNLPGCDSDNKSQLAYVIDEDQFYVCQDHWTEVAITAEKGDKGDKGDQGIPGTSLNNANQWVDNITGFTWILGGTATKGQADISCGNGYRLPTLAEGIDAVVHGIRLIALDISANPNFWVSTLTLSGNPRYVTIENGNAVGYDGTLTSTYSVFCVK